MIPASALIDDPVQCPGCGQPLNPSADWPQCLDDTFVMPCCNRRLARKVALDLAATIYGVRAAREGAKS